MKAAFKSGFFYHGHGPKKPAGVSTFMRLIKERRLRATFEMMDLVKLLQAIAVTAPQVERLRDLRLLPPLAVGEYAGFEVELQLPSQNVGEALAAAISDAARPFVWEALKSDIHREGIKAMEVTYLGAASPKPVPESWLDFDGVVIVLIHSTLIEGHPADSWYASRHGVRLQRRFLSESLRQAADERAADDDSFPIPL